jgi:hypothetical protein
VQLEETLKQRYHEYEPKQVPSGSVRNVQDIQNVQSCVRQIKLDYKKKLNEKPLGRYNRRIAGNGRRPFGAPQVEEEQKKKN